MLSSFSAAFVSGHAAHNRGQIFVTTDKWVLLCKLWFKMQVFLGISISFVMSRRSSLVPLHGIGLQGLV